MLEKKVSSDGWKRKGKEEEKKKSERERGNTITRTSQQTERQTDFLSNGKLETNGWFLEEKRVSKRSYTTEERLSNKLPVFFFNYLYLSYYSMLFGCALFLRFSVIRQLPLIFFLLSSGNLGVSRDSQPTQARNHVIPGTPGGEGRKRSIERESQPASQPASRLYAG